MKNELISRIVSLHSLSIVGMAKNTGKTVCLNYVLEQLQHTGKVVAVTSIGLDGEKTDQVTQTEKPEIELTEGMFFVTSEYHYRQRQLLSEICDVSGEMTSLGRLVTARVLQRGKVILTGPASTARVKALIGQLAAFGVDLTIVDGALSRVSPASPAVTEGLILSTGAALAPDLASIVSKTKFVYQLTQLPEYATAISEELMLADPGICAIEDDTLFRLPIESPLLFTKCKEKLFSHGTMLFVSGIVTDNMLEYLRVQPNVKEICLVVKDFTKIFVSPIVLGGFLRKGGRLMVVKRPNLLAISINPVSPSGFAVESERLRDALREVVGVPVFDVLSEVSL